MEERKFQVGDIVTLSHREDVSEAVITYIKYNESGTDGIVEVKAITKKTCKISTGIHQLQLKDPVKDEILVERIAQRKFGKKSSELDGEELIELDSIYCNCMEYLYESMRFASEMSRLNSNK